MNDQTPDTQNPADPFGVSPGSKDFASSDITGPGPVSKTSGGKPWKRGIALVGVLGLVGSGAFAARQFAGPSSNTPTEAVQAFLGAMSTNDVIGAMETLAPGERNLMIDSAVPMFEELKRLDVIDPKNDLNKLDSVGVKFAGQAFAEQPVREDIATVKMTGGTVTMSADPSRIVGGVVKQFEESLPKSEAKSEPFKEGSLTTIKRNGRWYVSLSYSVAEAARRDSGKPMPTAAESIAPSGAATAEAAVSDMMNKLGALDLRGAIALMDPDEMAALQDYAPLFLGEAEKAAAEARKSFTLTFPKLGLSSKQVDGQTVVSITKWSVDLAVNADGTKMQALLDGDCVQATIDGKSSKRCGKELPMLASDLTGDEEASKALSDVWSKQYESLLSNPGEAGGLTVVQRNGKWFVAPMRTVMSSIVTSLRKVKPEDLKGVGNTPEERLQSLFDNPLFSGASSVFGNAVPGLGGSLGSPMSEPAFSDPAFSDPAFSDPSFADPTVTDPTATDPTSGDGTVSFDATDPGLPVDETAGLPTTTLDFDAQMAEIDAQIKELEQMTSELGITTLP